ncbi:MAG: tetratricopeptide repeat protein [Deltaproteobacteria bacterium]|nr:tetratricopeptide repeat protein [Deltaproteobacteria bacterium]
MSLAVFTPRTLAAALAAVLVAGAPAWAAEAAPGPAAEAEAMALYAQGEEHYQAGRFEEALTSFKAAYRRLPAPGLLVNIGQCLRQLGDHQNAARAFERYLQEDPQADNRSEVEELIAAERALLAPPEATPAASVTPPQATAPASAGDDDGSMVWLAVGGAALALAVGGAVVVAVVAAQPQPLPVSGSLGTFDLR